MHGDKGKTAIKREQCEVVLEDKDDMEIDERLIQLIKIQPHLYDFDDKKFRDARLKQESWQAIAETLKLPLDAIHRRWKNLRDRFTRERRLTQRSINGAKPYNSRWNYYDQMNFFSPYLKGRRRYAKYPGFGGYEDSVNFLDECSITNSMPSESSMQSNVHNVMPNTEVLITAPSETLPSSSCSSVVEEDTLTNDMGMSLANQKRKSKDSHYNSWQDWNDMNCTVQPDECYYFGMYVGAKLKHLVPRVRSTVKIRILELLHDVEFNSE